jgi:hypothetical protein
MPKFRDWLCHLGCGEFTLHFINAGYDLKFIAEKGLTDADLDCIGIPNHKLGIRKKLLALFEIEKYYDAKQDSDEDEESEEEDDEESEEDDSEEGSYVDVSENEA